MLPSRHACHLTFKIQEIDYIILKNCLGVTRYNRAFPSEEA